MNFKSQAKKLQDFLLKTAPMWREEIMNEYPQTIDDYPREWIDILESLSPDELYQVDCKIIPSKIQGSSFHQFVQTISELTAVENIPETPEYPLEMWAFYGVKKKKRHEIQKIVPVLKRVRDERYFSYVVDIGGGVGHLSRVLSHYHQIPSISLDQNAEFQAIGKERLKKFRKLEGAEDVEFINHTFGDHSDPLKDLKIFNPDSLSLGLHTCGPLAHTLIKETVANKTLGLLNFGCCYFKINPEKDFPLSQFYKDENFIKPNLFGLTLATRSHAEMQRDTYNTKLRVKNYRYALHLFLMEKFNNKYFTDVGECPIQTYWKPFSEYTLPKLKELNLIHSFTAEDINDFYHSERIQRELRVMFLCNIIRWQIGRALEVYLQLDRCLYLEEHGYEVEFHQYFTESLSPRNLGILALKK
jgi:hypothetical protein